MGETNNKEIWKRLFHVLFNNKVADEELPNIWAKFKKENLHKSDIRTAIESFKDHLHKDVRKRLNESSEGSADEVSLLASSLKDLSVQYQIPNEVMDKLCDLRIEETGAEASILSLLRTSQLDNDFWRLLFTDIRDKEVDGISEEKVISILEGGQTKRMSMKDIEQKFISENPDLLTAQRAVPDQMIHDDLFDAHVNTESVRESLKSSYDKRFSEAKATLAEENPRWTNKEVEKQAAAQAKQEIKESREAKQLQHRVAMMAEDEVQKSILRAMKEFDIPVFVFRGVNTYDDIGKFLDKGFDITMSRLKAFSSGNSKSTLECEHDINAIALLPSGPPLVSLVQVAKLNSEEF